MGMGLALAGVIHAEGVRFGRGEHASSIIHAAGVGVGFPSSAPTARAVGSGRTTGSYRVDVKRSSLCRRCWK